MFDSNDIIKLSSWYWKVVWESRMQFQSLWRVTSGKMRAIINISIKTNYHILWIKTQFSLRCCEFPFHHCHSQKFSRSAEPISKFPRKISLKFTTPPIPRQNVKIMNNFTSWKQSVFDLFAQFKVDKRFFLFSIDFSLAYYWQSFLVKTFPRYRRHLTWMSLRTLAS